MNTRNTSNDRDTATVDAEIQAFTVDELAERLGIGRNTAYGLINDGAIRSVKVGRKRLIPRQALVEFLAGDSRLTGRTG